MLEWPITRVYIASLNRLVYLALITMLRSDGCVKYMYLLCTVL